ncbi:hypothetical protein GQ457_16G014030 [Hibiscus cannabinus]
MCLVHTTPLPGHAKTPPATTEEIVVAAGTNGADAASFHELSEVFAGDVSGHVLVSENALLGDEAVVFAVSVSNAVTVPVMLVPSFDAIEEWLADDGEFEVPGEEVHIQIPAKRSSDGSDPSRVKRAKSTVSTLALKDTRNAKAGMSSSKNSLAVVDKQPHRGRERLDRFLASTSWFTDFASFDVRTKFSAASNHCILILDTNFESSHMHSSSSGSFQFEECLAFIPDCVSTVQRTWNSTPGLVLDKLQAIGTNLDHWQHKRRVRTIGHINFLHHKLNRYLERNLSQMDAIDFINAKNELRNLLREQEVYWAQRSRIQWLKFGDKNTRFFHSRASARRKKKNHILGLYNSSNTWEEGSDFVLRIASAYFIKLFTSSFSRVDPMILDSIQPTITPSMNMNLTKPFTAKEVTTTF